MKNSIKTLLLLIEADADSSFLLNQGFTYAQISELFAQSIRQELIINDGDKFQLTSGGKKFILDNTFNGKYDTVSNWIAPDSRYVKPKVSTDEVFLPKLSESKF